VDSSLLGDMDLLLGQDGPGWLSHACHGGSSFLWASRKTTREPDGLTAGLGLSSLLLSEMTGAGSIRYSIDE